MSKCTDAELIKSTKSLYNDIDSCIGELIKARFDHNQENEGKALFRMEGLMVTILQQLDCIIDSLQEEQEVDLEVFRREAAKDILCAMIHHQNSTDSIEVSIAIDIADELIKQLKEKKK